MSKNLAKAVKSLSNHIYEVAIGHIRNNHAAFDKTVEVILEKEIRAGDEFRAILLEYIEIPIQNKVLVVTSLVPI